VLDSVDQRGRSGVIEPSAGGRRLELNADGTFIASTGCREITGRYTISGNQVQATIDPTTSSPARTRSGSRTRRSLRFSRRIQRDDRWHSLTLSGGDAGSATGRRLGHAASARSGPREHDDVRAERLASWSRALDAERTRVEREEERAGRRRCDTRAPAGQGRAPARRSSVSRTGEIGDEQANRVAVGGDQQSAVVAASSLADPPDSSSSAAAPMAITSVVSSAAESVIEMVVIGISAGDSSSSNGAGLRSSPMPYLERRRAVCSVTIWR